jgi:hypothetical protein
VDGAVTPLTKLTGWMPDVDPFAPGVIADCEMMEPSIRGMRAAASAANTGVAALPSDCRGAALVTKLNGAKRLLAGTQTRLYEANSTAWVDYSATTYTGGADSRWEFRQFGDVTIAVNGVDDPQSSTAATFTALTAMPVAKLAETVAGFVMVANISDASWPYSDGWWCSALLDETDWTPDVATQSARSRLVETPGEITALRSIGGDVVAFKVSSMYVGRYVGPDPIWTWQRVPGDVGAYAQQGVVSDGTALYFWGGDDFYRFDGTRPQPIGQAVRRWFAENASQAYLYQMLGQYDRAKSLARWYFAPNGASTPTQCIVYNTRTGAWGRADRAVQAVVGYVSSAVTYDASGALAAATFDGTLFPQSYNSPLWTASTEIPAVFNGSNVLQTLSGVAAASSLTTGEIGDDDRYLVLRKVRLRYSDSPNAASMTHYYAANPGGAYTTGTTSSIDDGKFDVLKSARWHRLRWDFAGDVEVAGYTVDVQPQGTR